MASNTITIPKLISAMKAAGFTTNSDLTRGNKKLKKELKEEIRNDMWDMLAQFGQEHTNPKFDNIHAQIESVNTKLDKQQKLLDELSAGQQFIRDDIKNLTVEYANTPSRKEFNQLKAHITSAKN